MSKPSAVAVVGDLHAGSTVGLMPPSFRLDAGQTITPSKQQAWLWKCWLEYCDWLDNFSLDAIVINGDLPNGLNARDAQNLTGNESDQINFVVDCLQPLLYKGNKRRAGSVYITRGTGYHSGGAGSREETIAREIGAVQDDTGAYSRYVNRLTWRDQSLFFTHHIQIAAVYPLTPLQRAQREWRVRCQKRGTRMPDVDIRSHVHTCHFIQSTDNKWMHTAPAWQLMTDFSHKVAPAGEEDFVTGGLLICLDEEGKVTVKRKLFPLPQPMEMMIPTLAPLSAKR
jgi:hypothetical protein